MNCDFQKFKTAGVHKIVTSYTWIIYFISSLNSHQIQSKSLSTVQIHKLLVQVREKENFLPSIIDVWYITRSTICWRTFSEGVHDPHWIPLTKTLKRKSKWRAKTLRFWRQTWSRSRLQKAKRVRSQNPNNFIDVILRVISYPIVEPGDVQIRNVEADAEVSLRLFEKLCWYRWKMLEIAKVE